MVRGWAGAGAGAAPPAFSEQPPLAASPTHPALSLIACLPLHHPRCRYFQYTGWTLPFDVYVINMDGATARLAAFQRTFEGSDLKAKNFVRFPAVNGSALDAGRLVSEQALADINTGGCAGAGRAGWVGGFVGLGGMQLLGFLIGVCRCAGFNGCASALHSSPSHPPCLWPHHCHPLPQPSARATAPSTTS